ncbi:MAG: NAD-dependent epimerase/dehydratase family protein [Actinomycetota bacterium]|nr:NAD-dependent epimerase/dehydratase family protein [Actinomycetota bacterium]
MRILILGGTRFVGRHIAGAALAAGHEVTLFTRGITAPDVWPEAEHLHGDRDGGLGALEGRSWHRVIDVCGYFPRIVEQSARLLSRAAEHYTFISTISVYRDFSEPRRHEGSPLGTLPDETVEEITGETYGPLKVLCEKAAEDAFGPERALIVRPGFVVGPHDDTDRFTYWVMRTAEGGEMLAPGPPERPMQFIDARDLASWVVRIAESGGTGAYNATGAPGSVTMGEVLETAAQVTGGDARIVWVDDAFLEERSLHDDLPLQGALGDASLAHLHEVDTSTAESAGLRHRPLTETVRDTWEWAKLSRPGGLAAGLNRDAERAALAAWRARSAS